MGVLEGTLALPGGLRVGQQLAGSNGTGRVFLNADVLNVTLHIDGDGERSIRLGTQGQTEAVGFGAGLLRVALLLRHLTL